MLSISTCINAIAFIGFSVAKRSYDDIDRADIICDALIQPFSSVPSRAGDLTSLINAPLTRKLPVSHNEETKFPLLADFIETKNDECESDLSKYISSLLTGIVEKQNLSNTSEDMLHWRVDSIIRIPLQIFHENLGGGVLPIDMDRNCKDQGTTTIGNKRPDFLCWTNNVLLFIGEEKAVIEDFPKAMNKLEEKFNKFDPMYFGNIQFMICYIAAGTRLRFFAIDGSSNINSPSRLITFSNQLEINNRRDRISILCIVVNIARIIRTMSTTIPAMIIPLGKRLKTEKSMITILGDSVEKRVSVEYLPFAGNLDDRINFLSKLYEHAKGHIGLAQVKESPKISRQGIYKVVLETRGHACQVRNEDEARVMSQCVLAGLSWLHKGGYVHRDIRLPNILFIPGDVECKYVLIDFEHANADGLVTSERLKDWDDKTLTKHNEYTTQSDLYQFGKMLRNLDTVNSEAGKNFLDGLRDKSISIENVLRHEWFG
ncbi:9608_t:CDS:1 [Gigaspora rosea]|nr:9608_t:CDS:1 [Gigaspora rosea]